MSPGPHLENHKYNIKMPLFRGEHACPARCEHICLTYDIHCLYEIYYLCLWGFKNTLVN